MHQFFDLGVAIGSRAEQGSSSRMTSGSTAIARAMHSRCCCPPDSPRALSLQPVLDLVPQRGAASGCFSTISSSSALAGDALDPRAVGHVLVDRLGERVRFLKDHADPLAQRVDVDLPGRGCRSPRSRISPSMRTPSIRSLSRLKQRSRVDLPQPDGPMNAVIFFAGISKLDRRAGPVWRRTTDDRFPGCSTRGRSTGTFAVQLQTGIASSTDRGPHDRGWMRTSASAYGAVAYLSQMVATRSRPGSSAVTTTISSSAVAKTRGLVASTLGLWNPTS